MLNVNLSFKLNIMNADLDTVHVYTDYEMDDLLAIHYLVKSLPSATFIIHLACDWSTDGKCFARLCTNSLKKWR